MLNVIPHHPQGLRRFSKRQSLSLTPYDANVPSSELRIHDPIGEAPYQASSIELNRIETWPGVGQERFGNEAYEETPY